MGSPVSAVIANMVMEDVETLALNTFTSDPKLWKRYVDDTFVLLKQDKLTDFFNHIKAGENSINFTMEKEKNGPIPFLDTLITRLEHGQLNTNGYRKPTHTVKYLHFRSEHPLAHKCAVLNTLVHRADKLCGQESERKTEIDLVRSTLKQNGYQDTLLYRKKSANATKNQEHEIRGLAILLYLQGLTDKIKLCLTTHKIQVTPKPLRKLGNLLTSIKDPVDIKSRQGVV